MKEIPMKLLLKLIVLLSVLLTFAGVAGVVSAQTHQGTGVVKRIDAVNGVVSLKHDAIKSLKWSAMTMEFKVRDKKLLEGLKPEQKVKFELVQEKSGTVITSIK
jgi:Cu(I)/Ag(I) efflux system periplasmic protein CusF